MTHTKSQRNAAGLCVVALALLSGCNTVDGLGDDLKSASQATKEAISGDSSSSTSTKSGTEGQGSSQTAPK